ncbi:MAG: DNA primase [Hyphomicrobiales bacterium]|nr:DNA primase [Hyphomicrobiales bacterium]
MRFPPSFLDEIRARVPVSSVVGRAVQWDRKKTNAGRGDYWACCPFHHEKTPSFHADDRQARYHCFGCKASGDIFRFLTEKQGMSFPEAVEQLASDAGLQMPEMSAEDVAREERRATLYDVMELAAKFFEEKLQTSDGAAARGYLADRGLTAGVQQTFRIGFAPAGRHYLKSYLVDKGITAEQLAETGLVVTGDDIAVPYDRFRDRIMFPIRDNRGRVIAFGGRAMSADVPAKYLNSPETALFHKGHVLYNLDQARAPAHENGTVIAVEGYMDVIAMTRAGLPHAVAPLGTALTPDQLALMWRIAPEPVLCFDGDAAGLKAAYRALDMALQHLRPGQSLRFALLPRDRDPDDLLRDEGAEAVQAVIAGAQALVDVLWNRALADNDRQTPETRARFEVDLEQTVRQIEDAKVRGHYEAEIGQRIKALWDQSGGGHTRFARGRRQPSAFQGRRSGKFGNFRPWDVKMPASPELRAISARADGAVGGERRERLIVLAVINHPELLQHDAEQFAAIEIATRELDSLRREIIDIAALNEGLDSDQLRHHLIQRNMAANLDKLELQAERLNSWHVERGAAIEDVRTGFEHMMALHRKMMLERELKAAELALAEHPSEEPFLLLNQIREELSSTQGEEAAIEGFGEASGRSAGTVS